MLFLSILIAGELLIKTKMIKYVLITERKKRKKNEFIRIS